MKRAVFFLAGLAACSTPPAPFVPGDEHPASPKAPETPYAAPENPFADAAPEPPPAPVSHGHHHPGGGR